MYFGVPRVSQRLEYLCATFNTWANQWLPLIERGTKPQPDCRKGTRNGAKRYGRVRNCLIESRLNQNEADLCSGARTSAGMAEKIKQLC
jgi:hypothetical protein